MEGNLERDRQTDRQIPKERERGVGGGGYLERMGGGGRGEEAGGGGGGGEKRDRQCEVLREYWQFTNYNAYLNERMETDSCACAFPYVGGFFFCFFFKNSYCLIGDYVCKR